MIININPIALDLGFLKIHWYGIMYLLAFTMAYILGNKRAKTTKGWNKEQVSDLIFYGAMGAVLGGRIGYMLFYNFSSLVDNPLNLFKIWQGGMSFHGGMIGVFISAWIFIKKYPKPYLALLDFIVLLAPLGLAAGRFGNFINGELWGKPTNLAWGMIFPNTDSLQLTRHPSMLYEMILEGFILFIILWIFSKKPRVHGSVFGLGLSCYGIFRFLVEFVREPDKQLGYLAWDWLTMGQLLSIPMIVIGLILIIVVNRPNQKNTK